MIDARLSFREHLEYIQGKAAATTRGLAWILLNTGGPKQNRRRLLVSDASAQERGRCSGFRTVSDDSILVIAGMVSLKERARELRELKETRTHSVWLRPRCNYKERRPGEVAHSLAGLLGHIDEGTMTYTLIPCLRRWVLRSHGQFDFNLTQVLSGHGCFRQYLKRFGHAEED
ncbi:hypothetical protein KR026_007331, partial [Drosophila bipectinata]